MSKEVRQYPHIKVLYIEDDSFTREKLLRVLKRRFRHVFVACNGEDGYQFYKNYTPDLVITDLKMSQENGLEMIRKIREQDDKVQIIVTTAHDENEIFIQSIEYNVNHFILKPIELDRFLLAIQKSIFQIQLEMELEKQKNLTRAILDSQDNIIFSIENNEIVEFNEAFSTVTGLHKTHSIPENFLISDFFIKDSQYFYPKNKKNWVNEFISDGKTFAKVKWNGKDGINRIYFMKSSSILNGKQLLFVCTDITDLETESQRKELFASIDPLTNIFTRQKFDVLLTNEIEKANRDFYPFSILLFDIDHFEKINTQFNNKEGDIVLSTISTMVQQCIGENDQFARWDGDKFILLAPEKNAEEGKALAEIIRTIVEEFHFQNIGKLTCSFGITEHKVEKSKKELINAAEQALAHSKQNGRNCSSISQ
ncbi:MAG: diguanylate cyclase [Bacillota bacterium]|nr:diguanylate cyclase [Bacillota bacterium]